MGLGSQELGVAAEKVEEGQRVAQSGQAKERKELVDR